MSKKGCVSNLAIKKMLGELTLVESNSEEEEKKTGEQNQFVCQVKGVHGAHSKVYVKRCGRIGSHKASFVAWQNV